MKDCVCAVCGFIHDESAGRPEDRIAPRTPECAVPEPRVCLDRRVSKTGLAMVEL
ncbi:MAG: rubredoxin [Burkholderiaceae bacterium]|nr:rubredoxin [Burkholderiaceae bacterium]